MINKIMLLLEILILVLTIPLASLYLSIILISRPERLDI